MGAGIYIGTSGWHYKHWLGLFYPEKLPGKEMLPFYARHLQTVEINNSFYRLPNPSTFRSWREETPKRFLFAVKASRFITHMKKLKAPVTSTEKFFLHVEELREKLGPILFQLPPRWQLDLERLSEFLEALPAGHRFTFEFRDRTWLVDEVYALLRKHNAAFCIYHLAGFETPLEITADFVYVRLHGPGGKYQGDYSRNDLKMWANRVRTWHADGRSIYVYFDNDQGGFAVKNAQELQTLVGETSAAKNDQVKFKKAISS